MRELLGKKVLITCSAWFYAPDGKVYRGVWGTLREVTEAKSVLGFVPNRTHANWFIRIGNMVITGCQVNYLVECPNVPYLGAVKRKMANAEATNNALLETEIYNAEV